MFTLKGVIASVAAAGLAAGVLVMGVGATDIGKLVPAHSHWDGTNNDYELRTSFELTGKASTAGSTIGWIPFRAQNSENYFQLTLLTTGFQLEKRVTGFPQRIIPPTFVATGIPVIGVGQSRNFTLVAQGAELSVWELLPDDITKGRKLMAWHDSQYLTGKYISYYTQVKWAGYWEFVHVVPLDTATEPHDILDLTQDARATGSIWGNPTFDPATPGNGGSVNRGHSESYGLPHGPNYTWVFDVTGSGTGTVDLLDPSPDQHFWAAGYYRLGLGTGVATLRRYSGKSTLEKTYTAASGGIGSYTFKVVNGDMTLSKGGQVLLHIAPDGGPTTGIRVKINAASTQTWTWTGTVN